jgi:hypothetical protein
MADNDGAKKYSPPLEITKSALILSKILAPGIQGNGLASAEREVAPRVSGIETIHGTFCTSGSPCNDMP